jgi:6-phosphogluconolactonase
MPSARSIEVFATAADLFHAAAEELVRAARDAIGAQGRFTVALSGGSTPKALYSLLATNYSTFAWNRVFLFFGDERHVPPTDPDSNYRMVNESLLTKIAIPAENVFRVPAENPDAAAAAADYESQLRRFFDLRPGDRPGEFPRFDLILLGVGPDGHTASLFPDSPALDEQARLVVANWVAKFNTHRITFTFPVLNRAAEVMFMASGADKATMLHQVLEGKNTPPLPSQRVQPSNGKLLWMLDEAAAAKLTR